MEVERTRWFQDIMNATDADAVELFETHQKEINTNLRMSVNTMVWMARERAIIDSTLNKQNALRLKLLAGMVTLAVWLFGAFTAYLAPVDTTCVSVCPAGNHT
eukprot:COSAG04_NODE_8616_length_950_cov_0.940071_2_plen_103_part_01